jgi:hypothetical protein
MAEGLAYDERMPSHAPARVLKQALQPADRAGSR